MKFKNYFVNQLYINAYTLQNKQTIHIHRNRKLAISFFGSKTKNVEHFAFTRSLYAVLFGNFMVSVQNLLTNFWQPLRAQPNERINTAECSFLIFAVEQSEDHINFGISFYLPNIRRNMLLNDASAVQSINNLRTFVTFA